MYRMLGILLCGALVAAFSGCGITGGEVEAGRGVVSGAAAKADASAQAMSRETRIPLDETQDIVCGLVDAYKTGSSPEGFVKWGLDQLQVPAHSRIYWERSLSDLEEAVEQAEDGDAMGAFVTATCAP